MQEITLKSLSSVKAGRTDFFDIFESPAELADCVEQARAAKRDNWTKHTRRNGRIDLQWFGGMRYEQALDATRNGDLSAVPESDRLMASLEHIAPAAQAWQTFDVMAGGSPNVGAYLSGSPVNMRMRKRVRKEAAPLSIVADLTVSAGLSGEQVRKRGVAILALVRMLSAVRPIELWAASGTDADSRDANYVLCRIDTAPLDLARASFVLSHAASIRGMFYSVGLYKRKFQGFWPYSGGPVRAHAEEIFGRVLSGTENTMFIPAAHSGDAAINKPTEWLADKLAQFGGEVMSGAA